MDFLNWLTEHWQTLSIILSNVSMGLMIFIATIRNHGGKDIDRDGVPDLPSKFNAYFVCIDGKRYYLKDLQFYKDSEEAK